MLHRIIYTLFFSLSSIYLLAQTGSIKGTIKDAKTGDALIGATVLIEGTTNGAAADIEGNFMIAKAPAGAATLTVSYVGYLAKKINVQVESGKSTVVNTALDEDAGQALAEVVVTAERPTNTEVSLISEIRTAQQIATGVSAEQIVRTQDRDAAQVARRVPGVSIVENRFVLVRGLTQRYNTVLINDVISPSTEVDVRSFSFDMIPSNMLDRMVVYKSGAADLPGEFAGGIIRVFTKKAPEENFFNIGVTAGYRANTTFQSTPTTGSGKFDFLGFDNGDRAIPDGVPGSTQRFNNLPSPRRAELINQLPNRWAVNYGNANPDLRINVNLGRRFDIGGLRVGNLTGINYSNTNQYADVVLNSYTNGETPGELEVQSNDQQFASNARLGILHNWLFRFNPNFSIEFKNLFNQLGSNETVVRKATDFVEGRPVALYSQRFESRSIYTGQLIGNNTLGEGRTDINWRLGYAYTRRTEPDWRRVRYVDEPLTAAISNQPVLINAGRFFSELNENVFTAGGDVEHKLGDLAAEDAIKLKAGVYAERKDRDFDARFFGYTNGDTTRKRLPVDQIFSPENATGRDLNAFSVQEEFNPSNRYDAANTLLAGYAQAYIPFGNFNATVGLRMEYNRQELNSRNRGGNRINVDNPVLSPLPSVNLAYNLNDKQLVRVAYAYTVNRPEFRELAPFRYYDFNINADIEGNEFLETAQIHNADVRWEYYPSPSELVSFGVFYKYFNKPIESYLRTQPGAISYTFVNADNATSYGAEVEIRKSFSELSQSRFFQSLSVVANASYIFSNIDMGPSVRVGSAVSSAPLPVSGLVDRNRPMQNQSPYLVNGGLYYSDEKAGLQVNVLYNIFGKRVFAVGSLEEPTIYEMPRSVLDFNITKNIGPKLEVRFSAQDILNQAFRLEQDYNNDAKIEGGADGNQVIRSFRRGQYFTVGINYNFNRKSLTPTTN